MENDRGRSWVHLGVHSFDDVFDLAGWQFGKRAQGKSRVGSSESGLDDAE